MPKEAHAHVEGKEGDAVVVDGRLEVQVQESGGEWQGGRNRGRCAFRLGWSSVASGYIRMRFGLGFDEEKGPRTTGIWCQRAS